MSRLRAASGVLIVVGVALFVYGTSGFDGAAESHQWDAGPEWSAGFSFDDVDRVTMTLGAVLATCGLLMRRGDAHH